MKVKIGGMGYGLNMLAVSHPLCGVACPIFDLSPEKNIYRNRETVAVAL